MGYLPVDAIFLTFVSRVFTKIHLSACKYTKLFSDFCVIVLKSVHSSPLCDFFSCYLLKFCSKLLGSIFLCSL